MTSTVHFERLAFSEIVAAIRRIFPVAGGFDFGLSPDSIDRYFEHGGRRLSWRPIPDWTSYEHGRRDISVEDFIELLFSPLKPRRDEPLFAVTDECIWESRHLGFSIRFADLA